MADNYFPGQVDGVSYSSDFNVTNFIIQSVLSTVRTATLVKVVAVHSSAPSLGPVGTVDVLPLVSMVNGAGETQPHGTVYSLPYVRIQGGAWAIVLDPQVGDLGLAVFADRDISAVKTSKAQSSPGSNRRFSFSDGIYLGGLLSGTPTQYVFLSSSGVKIVDLNTNIIEMKSTGIKITDKNSNIIEMKSGSIAITGNLTVTGSVTAGFGGGDQVSLQTHIHAGVQSGASSTAAPTPGT